MSLQDTTDVLLSHPERTAAWLQLADRYIQQYNKDPMQFILPKQHAFLLPIIETYSSNALAFMRYIRGVRDSFSRGSDAALEMQLLHRRVNSRSVQQIRRERTTRAMRKAEEMHGPAPFTTKQAWVARLEQIWSKRRLAFMDAASAGKRLTVDERAELLAEFWDGIDNEITHGERIWQWNKNRH